MARAVLIFEDDGEGDVKMGMNLDKESQEAMANGDMEMTKAIFYGTLASYIFEQGHHEQFRDEFFKETARIMDDAIINNNPNIVDMRDESQKPKRPTPSNDQ